MTWRDLTVPNATDVRDFYCDVVGWRANDHDMGGYADYEMLTPERGDCVAGICHSRGTNAPIPPQWLIYITVADADASAARCVARGGQVLDGPREVGGQRFCVIQDPAGAVAALVSSS